MIQLNDDNTIKQADLGVKGVFRMVDKNELRIDRMYQRETSLKRSRAIAANFNWCVFGALSVVQRMDGKKYVVDGGHRSAAANLRPEIRRVPCVVFEFDSIEQEAKAFEMVNKHRRAMGGLEVWKAQEVAKVPETIEAKRILKDYGLKVGSEHNATTIKAAQAVWRLQRAGTLESVLAFLTEAWSGHPRITNSATLSAAHCLHKTLAMKGQSITDDNAIYTFKSVSFDKLWQEASYICHTDGTTMAHALWGVFIKHYNKRRRSTRIPMQVALATSD